MSEEAIRAELEACFDCFDSDKSGFMEYDELLKATLKFNESSECGCKMSEEDAKGIIEALDKNKDNKVSKQEFVDFLYSHLSK